MAFTMLRKLFFILVAAAACSVPVAAIPTETEAGQKETAIAASAGMLVISDSSGNGVKYTVYSITGQTVKTIIVKNESVAIRLPQGFYIVKSDNQTVKVVVK